MALSGVMQHLHKASLPLLPSLSTNPRLPFPQTSAAVPSSLCHKRCCCCLPTHKPLLLFSLFPHPQTHATAATVSLSTNLCYCFSFPPPPTNLCCCCCHCLFLQASAVVPSSLTHKPLLLLLLQSLPTSLCCCLIHKAL